MKQTSFLQAGFLSMGVVLLAACGHDRFDDGFDDGFDADVAGIYEGTITDNVTHVTTAVSGIIDENYEGVFGTPSGQYYRLSNLRNSGDDVRADFTAYSGSGNFVNGSSTTQGSISGQFTTQGLSLAFNAQGNDSGTLSLNFDKAYYNGSSLPTLAGNWSYNSDAFSLSLVIMSTGAFTGTDSDGCSYSGFFSLADYRYNAYTENYTLTCNGVATSYEGLSDFVAPSGSGSSALPAQIMLLADDNKGGFLNVAVVQN